MASYSPVTLSNGATYSGGWRNGRFDGLGVYCRADGSMPERPDLSKIYLTAYLPRIPIFRVTQTTTIEKNCGHGIIFKFNHSRKNIHMAPKPVRLRGAHLRRLTQNTTNQRPSGQISSKSIWPHTYYASQFP